MPEDVSMVKIKKKELIDKSVPHQLEEERPVADTRKWAQVQARWNRTWNGNSYYHFLYG